MKKQSGFTLIEVLIVVVIMAILLMVAIPGYQGIVAKSKRGEAIALLTRIAGEQEQYFSENNRYADSLTTLGYGADRIDSENGVYSVTSTSNTSRDFLLTAQPDSTQAARDTDCGSFTLNQAGSRGVTGPASPSDCW